MGNLKKKDLVSAYKELDKVVGIDPAIEYDELTLPEFEKELHGSLSLIEEGDKFSKATQAVFDALIEKYGEPGDEEEDVEDEDEDVEDEDEDEDADNEDEDDDAEEEPAPKKGKAKPEPVVVKKPAKKKVVEEDDEDEDEDDEEEPAPPIKAKGKAKPKVEVVEEDEDEGDEDEGDEDEGDEDEDLASVVKSTMKKDELHILIKENAEFKKKKKELLAEKSVFTLKKMMLDILGVKSKGKADEKPIKKEKAKKEKTPQLAWPEGFAKGDNVTFTDRKGEKITGTLEKYFWHKQSERFWFMMIANGKNFYKHIEDVKKVGKKDKSK
jgi:hypothetical protein